MPPRRRKPPRPGALSDLPPLRILRTIALLQLSYYLTAIILIGFSSLVLGQGFSLTLIFDWRSVRGDITQGWVIGIVWILTSFITVIPLLILLSRSKLVPDFALTVHLIHTLTTSFYTRALPTNLLWWLLQFSSAFLMISLGVWACRYREMKPISFGLGAPAAKEGGLSVGKTRAREEGGSSYEMAPLVKEGDGVVGDENV